MACCASSSSAKELWSPGIVKPATPRRSATSICWFSAMRCNGWGSSPRAWASSPFYQRRTSSAPSCRRSAFRSLCRASSGRETLRCSCSAAPFNALSLEPSRSSPATRAWIGLSHTPNARSSLEIWLEQAYRLAALLEQQAVTAFDKTDPTNPNALKYPSRALREVMINALAHRDYSLVDPTRITVFEDRIEMISPGPLPVGVDPGEFRAGRAAPKWRNQALAWFLNRLQFAQAEGQGIPTVLRSMQQEGCPPPVFTTSDARVICTLCAHPRHTAPAPTTERDRWKVRLLEIINRGGTGGTPFEALSRAFPTATRNDLRVLLRELRKAGRIHVLGATKAARWFPGSEQP